MTNSSNTLDPNSFGPVESPFDTGHPYDRLIDSPHQGYSNSQSHAQDPVDNIFDEFVTQPEDDMNNRNEVAEALEEVNRGNDEQDDRRDVLHDFVNDSYRK